MFASSRASISSRWQHQHLRAESNGASDAGISRRASARGSGDGFEKGGTETAGFEPACVLAVPRAEVGGDHESREERGVFARDDCRGVSSPWCSRGAEADRVSMASAGATVQTSPSTVVSKRMGVQPGRPRNEKLKKLGAW